MVASHLLSRRSRIRGTVIALPLTALILSGCGTAAKNDTYDLPAAVDGSGPAAKSRQILIASPTALRSLDSEQIVIRVSPSEIQYLSKAQWGDKLPRIVQSKLVEAFENSGKLGGVGMPGQGLAIDYQIVTDIRSFEIDASNGNQAVVEISAKILNDRNGSVRTQKVFRAMAPAGGDNDGFVKGLDRAFSTVASEIVSWTLRSI
ncbi:ABC-type transport auxiliary lipoprotein family protein [Rhizobium leguminosarum]|jgi:cholesterol transport system auxiliary component|uniref:ABC-type transport auxiliary lipoprotein family protein n=1 Tax=Rhizobium TaxID=379 RepID=UPI00036A140F|nr:ABC-type transport auxiliary lipoprotein family protein [Rhizobium leguminosarum]MBA8830982.1 cholesterol transport system auxiliary component [Rhizobium leguminosarum]MBA9029676.1 cholesterol transport system auxiliary component [Rhizobium leguminosarum]MBP2487741.1 cholesterol transport system auxiliary component [Rhizobium leguminosarum]MDH6273293.1 cholesterol transport system auxiliary component [Rhizobium leguminosarum]MDV4162339.1 ABC-type transport auxiliary lipoprotein family prote